MLIEYVDCYAVSCIEKPSMIAIDQRSSETRSENASLVYTTRQSLGVLSNSAADRMRREQPFLLCVLGLIVYIAAVIPVPT